jgi:hypothetical protein
MRIEQFFHAAQNTRKLQERILEYASPVKVLEVRGANVRVSWKSGVSYLG